MKSARCLWLSALCAGGLLSSAWPTVAQEPGGRAASGQVAPEDGFWEFHPTGTSSSLRGISAVSADVCWASGSGGCVIRTTDGGRNWERLDPPGSGSLDFRDVQAMDADTAIVMSAGHPNRIYRTTDGGQEWQLVFEESDERAFFDGMAFVSRSGEGWLFGDPLDGRLYLAKTTDFGETWSRLEASRSPALPAGVAGFAASGSSIIVWKEPAGTSEAASILIGLGGAGTGEALQGASPEKAVAGQSGQDEKPAPTDSTWVGVVFSPDGGRSWTVHSVPMQAGESRGVFSVARVLPSGCLVAAGGDYRNPESRLGTAALGDRTNMEWRLPSGELPGGYRSAVDWYIPNSSSGALLAICTGPGGTDRSLDSGEGWEPASTAGFHTLAATPDRRWLWAAGSEGRAARTRPASR